MNVLPPRFEHCLRKFKFIKYNYNSSNMLVSVFCKSLLNSIRSNCLAGRAPEYLTELCHSVNDIPARRNLRSSSQVQLLVPRFRKERSGRRGFSVSSPQLWNLLPVDIRLHHNEHQLLRRRLKTHYMQQSLLHH